MSRRPPPPPPPRANSCPPLTARGRMSLLQSGRCPLRRLLRRHPPLRRGASTPMALWPSLPFHSPCSSLHPRPPPPPLGMKTMALPASRPSSERPTWTRPSPASSRDRRRRAPMCPHCRLTLPSSSESGRPSTETAPRMRPDIVLRPPPSSPSEKMTAPPASRLTSVLPTWPRPFPASSPGCRCQESPRPRPHTLPSIPPTRHPPPVESAPGARGPRRRAHLRQHPAAPVPLSRRPSYSSARSC